MGLAPLTPTRNGLALSFLGKCAQPSPGLAVPRPPQTVLSLCPGIRLLTQLFPGPGAHLPLTLQTPGQPDEALSTRQAHRHTVDALTEKAVMVPRLSPRLPADQTEDCTLASRTLSLRRHGPATADVCLPPCQAKGHVLNVQGPLGPLAEINIPTVTAYSVSD